MPSGDMRAMALSTTARSKSDRKPSATPRRLPEGDATQYFSAFRPT
jgi:hypothetical protein